MKYLEVRSVDGNRISIPLSLNPVVMELRNEDRVQNGATTGVVFGSVTIYSNDSYEELIKQYK
jgi:hypothetical protein